MLIFVELSYNQFLIMVNSKNLLKNPENSIKNPKNFAWCNINMVEGYCYFNSIELQYLGR